MQSLFLAMLGIGLIAISDNFLMTALGTSAVIGSIVVMALDAGEVE